MAESKTKAASKKSSTFTAEEQAAMKEIAAERRAEARRKKSGKKADGEADLLAKVKEMPKADRDIAERIHAIVKENAPHLTSKTWYGMPAHANADGKVVCFFQSAAKFKARYATFGFNDAAMLDDGNMWAASFALIKLTPDEEKKIAALVRKAAG